MRIRRGSRRTALALFTACAVLAACSSTFAVWSWGEVGQAERAHIRAESALARALGERDAAASRRDARNEASRKAHEAEANAEKARAEASRLRLEREMQDQFWAGQGYENMGSNVYFRWLEDSEYSCGNWDCAGFAVVAADGCPGGLYLEAAIMSGDSQVGWTNETFAAIPAKGSAAGIFEMVAATGDSFTLSEVYCR